MTRYGVNPMKKFAQNEASSVENESALFELIPRDLRFSPIGEIAEDSHTTNDSGAIFNNSTAAKESLLQAAGYYNTSGNCMRNNRIEEIFHLKPAFIWNNGLPKQRENAQKMLKILVADQDALFKDGEYVYRSRYQNAQYLSERKENRRTQYLHSERLMVIEQIMSDILYYDKSISKELTKELFYCVVDNAARHRRKLSDWLFSNQHIGITEYNLEYYAEKYKIDGDGYYDKNSDINLPNSVRDWRNFGARLRKSPNFNDIFLLDFSKCAADFQQMLPPEKATFVTAEFSEWFISQCLLPYIRYQQYLNECFPEEVECCDKILAEKKFLNFNVKYTYLEELEAGFSNEHYPLSYENPNLDWGTKHQKEYEQKVLKIEKAIRDFFCSLDLPLRSDVDCYLKAHINWVCAYSLLSGKHHTTSNSSDELFEKPMLLLAMVLTCRRRIISDKCFPVSLDKLFPVHISQVRKSTQRYCEVVLLNRLHQILKLSWSEQVKSWNIYCDSQGKEIQSLEELKFWKKLLCSANGSNSIAEYKQIPAIGFQLCFLDYCNSCMPDHLEKLSYRNASNAHLGGYYQFYNENSVKIHQLSMALDAKHTKEYKRIWQSLGCKNKERYKFLENILPDYLNQEVIKLCPNEEYQCLVLETAIQKRIREAAKLKLFKWFDKAYGCSLTKMTAKETAFI